MIKFFLLAAIISATLCACESDHGQGNYSVYLDDKAWQCTASILDPRGAHTGGGKTSRKYFATCQCVQYTNKSLGPQPRDNMVCTPERFTQDDAITKADGYVKVYPE